MKNCIPLYHIVFYCAISTALLQCICCFHPSSAATMDFSGRKLMRLSTDSTPRSKVMEPQITEEESQRLMHQEGFDGVEFWTSGNDGDESVYHIDYRGVTTHPSPNPKHPRP